MEPGMRYESATSQRPREQSHRGHVKDVCLSPKGNNMELKGVQQERVVNSSHLHRLQI